MPRNPKPKLSDQCTAVGWPVAQISAARTTQKEWLLGDVAVPDPEAVAAFHIASLGEDCSWCEGASINLLIKAAALDTLARLNPFDDRADAVRRYLEAQFTILGANINEVLAAVANVNQDVVERNLREVLADPFIQEAYPRVNLRFEPPRVSRRLNTLRGLSHEQVEQVLARGA